MKTIELTQGKVTVVDDDVYKWASRFKWYAIEDGQTFYAVRWTRKTKKKNRALIRLHREILQSVPGLKVDHRDSNGLNNLRENLRPATTTQNGQNRRHQKNLSGFKGVTANGRKWGARITISGKELRLGSFAVEEDAARAYDAAAKKYFGEFASLNFPLLSTKRLSAIEASLATLIAKQKTP